MPLIVWTDRMSVGVKLLDNDHKSLVLLINKLYDGVVAGRDRRSLKDLFEELATLTRLHFYHEERLLSETGFPGAVVHRQEHDQLFDQFADMQRRFTHSIDLAGDIEVMYQLRVWLFKHTQGADQDFVAHLKAKGADAILAAWDKPNGVEPKRPGIQP